MQTISEKARKSARFSCWLLLFLILPTALSAQGLRTGSLGIRLDGGLQWSVGSGLADAVAKGPTAIQPMGGAGVYYNIIPRLRAGLDYNYTRMVREQTNGTLSPISGGGVAGEVYKDLKTHFHGIGVTGEYNLLPAGPLSLYAGTGAGCLIAVGNTYSIAVSNEVKPGGTGNSIRISAHNEGHHYAVPYIPLTLSLEFAFMPRVALSLGGGYRFILAGRQEYAPKGQAYATLGLRFNL